MTTTTEAPPVDPETGGAWDRGRIITALELEAAWGRAKMLEEERDTALKRVAEYRDAQGQAFEIGSAYRRGIYDIMRKHGPAADAAGILAELSRLYENPLGE